MYWTPVVKTPTFSLVYKYLSSETLERFSISECGFISLPCIFAGRLVLITAQPVKKWATLCGSTGLGNSPGVLGDLLSPLSAVLYVYSSFLLEKKMPFSLTLSLAHVQTWCMMNICQIHEQKPWQTL